MNVLITGGNGQLGKTFQALKEKEHSIHSLSKEELDVTDSKAVEDCFEKYNPGLVIHAAAYTAVDSAELYQKKAYDVNAVGALNVARSANEIGATMVYISTDYVFDGEKETFYIEEDEPNPKSVYGLSKWLGEVLVRRTSPKHYIVRTSWLFGHGGGNFVKTMAELGRRKREVQVVADQFGAPTYTNDLASTIFELIGKPYGIYHISNSGSCSWYEFARKIYEELDADPTLVKPVTTEKYGAKAPRPAYSVMNLEKLVSTGVSRPRHWEEALKQFFKTNRFY
jgi:dTDP-4-dehydrorhamnose reductase